MQEVPAQITVEQPKQNNFLVILLSILLLISCVIAGFFAYQTQKLVNELRVVSDELKQITTPEPTVDPTSDWKTYTSSKFGFSFKYPKELSYLYDQTNQYSETGVSNAMILLQNFDGLKPRTELGSDFQIVIYIANKSGQFNLENPQGKMEEVMIDDTVAIKTFTTQKWIQVPTVFFQDVPNKVAVQFSNPDSSNALLFDQILSTFKFTN